MDILLNQPSFSRFAEILSHHLAELKHSNPTHSSVEWYLLNHLQALSDNVSLSSSAREVAKSVNNLSRFATDSLEWSGQLIECVDEILITHAALMKSELDNMSLSRD